MTKLQTRREYLVGLGLAKEGRGKFSNAAKEALAKADAEGYEFLDGPSPKGNGSGLILSTAPKAATGPTRAVAKPAETAASKADAGFTPYLSPSDFRFPEAEYKAVGVDGKTYGMRECCNNCRVSLTNHSCNEPTIHGNMVVHIRKR